VLQLKHAQTNRKALLFQADMDVDADGSDSDRLPAGSGAPTNFKPFTSYKWNKKTQVPNPYLPMIEEKLRRAEEEWLVRTTTADRKRDLRNAIAQFQNEIATLKKFSFLIGTTDPFIVIPSNFARSGGAKVGDYALIMFGEKICPALVGDIGPNDKTGEASLRIAKEFNAASTAYSRPVSDLKVTYLIFPGTAETSFSPPDLDKIQVHCQALVDEIGGAGVPLHHWENIIPPPPTPTPAPTPSPAPTFAFPLPSSSPTPSPAS
jgi:Fungal chitosanase of glycosyl hydrolase group 75